MSADKISKFYLLANVRGLSSDKNNKDKIRTRRSRTNCGRTKFGHQIEGFVKTDPYKASTRDLASEYNTSKTTIAQTLHEKGFEYKTVHKQPELTEEHKSQRIKFYQNILKGLTQINCIWFSDEMGYHLQSSREKVWTDSKFFSSGRPSRDKVNVWAVISVFGKTSL